MINVPFHGSGLPTCPGIVDGAVTDVHARQCMSLPTAFDANRISCARVVRPCCVHVDALSFHTSFMEAYYYVLSVKWLRDVDTE